jgi:hypothetical protein
MFPGAHLGSPIGGGQAQLHFPFFPPPLFPPHLSLSPAKPSVGKNELKLSQPPELIPLVKKSSFVSQCHLTMEENNKNQKSNERDQNSSPESHQN